MLQVTDDLIRGIVQEVLGHMKSPSVVSPSRNGAAGRWGVFDSVEEAVATAVKAQRDFERRGMHQRKEAVACIRKICIDKSEELGREEFEETKIGRLVHKIDKLVGCAERTPGVEFLKTEAYSGG